MRGTAESGQVLATSFDLSGKRVFVAGHTGMVGGAIVRRLKSEDCEIVTVSSKDLDLRRQSGVEEWMSQMRPDVVFLAAARVGGILANSTRPAEFLFDNLIDYKSFEFLSKLFNACLNGCFSYPCLFLR